MSDIIINVDTALLRPCPKRDSEGSRRHQRFLRRRRFLEKKGFLRPKQLPPLPPPQAALPRQDASHGHAAMDHGQRAKQRLKTGGHHSRGPHGGAGRDCWRKTGPKENATCFATHPQAGAMPPSSQTGRNSAEPRGPKNDDCDAGKGLGETDLQSDNDGGLPSAPAPAPLKPGKIVAVDCEMVGTGPGGRNSDLARCSIVGYYGDVMYDKYVRPINPITNYRTRWSGIRRHHMTNAVPFKAAQKEILKILSGKIVIGHAIHNDFKALKYFHPKSATRDTSKIPLLNRKAGFPEHESASLKRLTKQLLHRDIQVDQNGHSSVEDARATMELYRMVEADWESYLASSPAQDS